MFKTATAIALLGASLAAQPALAGSNINVDVKVKVVTESHPSSREVCNEFTCWVESGFTPRSRRVDESVERYRRTTTESN